MKSKILLLALFALCNFISFSQLESTYSFVKIDLEDGRSFTSKEADLVSSTFERINSNSGKTVLYFTFKNGKKEKFKGSDVTLLIIKDIVTNVEYNCYSFNNMLLMAYFKNDKVSYYKDFSLNMSGFYYLQRGDSKPKVLAHNDSKYLVNKLGCSKLKEKFNAGKNGGFENFDDKFLLYLEILDFYCSNCE